MFHFPPPIPHCDSGPPTQKRPTTAGDNAMQSSKSMRKRLSLPSVKRNSLAQHSLSSASGSSKSKRQVSLSSRPGPTVLSTATSPNPTGTLKATNTGLPPGLLYCDLEEISALYPHPHQPPIPQVVTSDSSSSIYSQDPDQDQDLIPSSPTLGTWGFSSSPSPSALPPFDSSPYKAEPAHARDICDSDNCGNGLTPEDDLFVKFEECPHHVFHKGCLERDLGRRLSEYGKGEEEVELVCPFAIPIKRVVLKQSGVGLDDTSRRAGESERLGRVRETEKEREEGRGMSGVDDKGRASRTEKSEKSKKSKRRGLKRLMVKMIDMKV